MTAAIRKNLLALKIKPKILSKTLSPLIELNFLNTMPIPTIKSQKSISVIKKPVKLTAALL